MNMKEDENETAFIIERLCLGFLFRVYLFLVHKLNFQIISNSKNENVFGSCCRISMLLSGWV